MSSIKISSKDAINSHTVPQNKSVYDALREMKKKERQEKNKYSDSLSERDKQRSRNEKSIKENTISRDRKAREEEEEEEELKIVFPKKSTSSNSSSTQYRENSPGKPEKITEIECHNCSKIISKEFPFCPWCSTKTKLDNEQERQEYQKDIAEKPKEKQITINNKDDHLVSRERIKANEKKEAEPKRTIDQKSGGDQITSPTNRNGAKNSPGISRNIKEGGLTKQSIVPTDSKSKGRFLDDDFESISVPKKIENQNTRDNNKSDRDYPKFSDQKREIEKQKERDQFQKDKQRDHHYQREKSKESLPKDQQHKPKEQERDIHQRDKQKELQKSKDQQRDHHLILQKDKQRDHHDQREKSKESLLKDQQHKPKEQERDLFQKRETEQQRERQKERDQFQKDKQRDHHDQREKSKESLLKDQQHKPKEQDHQKQLVNKEIKPENHQKSIFPEKTTNVGKSEQHEKKRKFQDTDLDSSYESLQIPKKKQILSPEVSENKPKRDFQQIEKEKSTDDNDDDDEVIVRKKIQGTNKGSSQDDHETKVIKNSVTQKSTKSSGSLTRTNDQKKKSDLEKAREVLDNSYSGQLKYYNPNPSRDLHRYDEYSEGDSFEDDDDYSSDDGFVVKTGSRMTDEQKRAVASLVQKKVPTRRSKYEPKDASDSDPEFVDDGEENTFDGFEKAELKGTIKALRVDIAEREREKEEERRKKERLKLLQQKATSRDNNPTQPLQQKSSIQIQKPIQERNTSSINTFTQKTKFSKISDTEL